MADDDLGDFFAEVAEIEESTIKYEEEKNDTHQPPSNAGLKRKRDDTIIDGDNHASKRHAPLQDKTKTSVVTPAVPDAPSSAHAKVMPHHLLLVSDTRMEGPRTIIGSVGSTDAPSSNWESRRVTVATAAVKRDKTSNNALQKDASVPPPPPPPPQIKAPVRHMAGTTWKDETLLDFPDNDYRIFVGDLDRETQSEALEACFKSKYHSFAMARIITHKTGQYKGKGKGYGFVSFLDPMECAKAIREEQGKLCQGRPMKITKSKWQDRDIKEQKKKEKTKAKMLASLGL
jgi:hypothetical protein